MIPNLFKLKNENMIKLGVQHATTTDCANVRYICECVSSRSAYLVSAGIATLINKMNERSVTVRPLALFIEFVSN